MAASHGSLARLYAGGYDLSGQMRGAAMAQSADVAEATPWFNEATGQASKSKVYVPGLKDATLSGEGIFDGAIDRIDPILAAALGQGGSVLCLLPTGDVFGARSKSLSSIFTTVETDSPVDDIVTISLEAQASGGGNPGKILRATTGALDISGPGNGTTLDDLGAAGTTEFGGAGFLQVIDKGGGAGTLTVKIQDSVDGSVWADLLTFTGVTIKNVAEKIEVSGTVDRRLRAQWAVTGGTWDFHVNFSRRYT